MKATESTRPWTARLQRSPGERQYVSFVARIDSGGYVRGALPDKVASASARHLSSAAAVTTTPIDTETVTAKPLSSPAPISDAPIKPGPSNKTGN